MTSNNTLAHRRLSLVSEAACMAGTLLFLAAGCGSSRPPSAGVTTPPPPTTMAPQPEQDPMLAQIERDSSGYALSMEAPMSRIGFIPAENADQAIERVGQYESAITPATIGASWRYKSSTFAPFASSDSAVATSIPDDFTATYAGSTLAVRLGTDNQPDLSNPLGGEISITARFAGYQSTGTAAITNLRYLNTGALLDTDTVDDGSINFVDLTMFNGFSEDGRVQFIDVNEQGASIDGIFVEANGDGIPQSALGVWQLNTTEGHERGQEPDFIHFEGSFGAGMQ